MYSQQFKDALTRIISLKEKNFKKDQCQDVLPSQVLSGLASPRVAD
jgi:hypothetical protein